MKCIQIHNIYTYISIVKRQMILKMAPKLDFVRIKYNIKNSKREQTTLVLTLECMKSIMNLCARIPKERSLFEVSIKFSSVSESFDKTKLFLGFFVFLIKQKKKPRFTSDIPHEIRKVSDRWLLFYNYRPIVWLETRNLA